MRKRILALLLVLVMGLTLFTGCGLKKNEEKDEKETYEQELETGTYEMRDEDDDVVGYLKVSKRKITVFDQDGEQVDEIRYEFNDEDGIYYVDEDEGFTVKKKRSTLTLSTLDDDIFKGYDEDDYTLEAIEEDEIPTGGAADTPEPAPTEEPEPTPTPTPTPTQTSRLMPPGCYALYDESDDLTNYLKVSDSTITIYYYDGEEDRELDYTYDPADESYDVGTFVITAELRNGTLYIYDGSDEYRTVAIPESDIPVYTGGSSGDLESYTIHAGSHTLYLQLPTELYQALEEDGNTLNADYYNGTSYFSFYSNVYEGNDRQALIDEAKSAGYTGDRSGVFKYEADTVFNGMKDTFASIGVTSPTYNTYTDTLYGIDWDAASIYGGYQTDNTLDMYYHMYMDDGVIIEFLVVAFVSNADGNYSQNYDRFLSQANGGWLYAVSESYDLW